MRVNVTETETAQAPETTPETSAASEGHALLTKPPSHLHRHYAVWIKDKTGYGPDAPAEGGAPSEAWNDFVKVVQLAVVQYGVYQRSPENLERRDAERVEKAEEAEKAAVARENAKAAKAAEKAKALEAKAAAKAKADDGETTESNVATPKRGAAKKAGASAAAKVEAPF